MSAYRTLQMDNLPDVLKKRPRLVTCITMALGLLAITMSAVSIGIFIGYTYCYLEYHTGFKTVPGNTSSYISYQEMALSESDAVRYNRTINGALMSNVLVSKILKIGHALLDEDIVQIPGHCPNHNDILHE